MTGDFLFVPEGGIHGFRNESGAPASANCPALRSRPARISGVQSLVRATCPPLGTKDLGKPGRGAGDGQPVITDIGEYRLFSPCMTDLGFGELKHPGIVSGPLRYVRRECDHQVLPLGTVTGVRPDEHCVDVAVDTHCAAGRRPEHGPVYRCWIPGRQHLLDEVQEPCAQLGQGGAAIGTTDGFDTFVPLE